MTKKQLERLAIFLEGYCQFTIAGPSTCDAKTLTATKFYLKNALGFDKEKIKRATEYLNKKGAFCDCEVLFNVVK